MHIEIWSVGKENESFIEEGLKYYFQKTRPYNSVELVILHPNKKTATTDVDRTKLQEEEMLLKKLQPKTAMQTKSLTNLLKAKSLTTLTKKRSSSSLEE